MDKLLAMIVKDEKEWKLLTRLCRLLIQAKNVQTANSCYNPCPSYETVIQNSPYVSKLGKKNMQFIRLECYTYPLNNDNTSTVFWIPKVTNKLATSDHTLRWHCCQLNGDTKSLILWVPPHTRGHTGTQMAFFCSFAITVLTCWCISAKLPPWITAKNQEKQLHYLFCSQIICII